MTLLNNCQNPGEGTPDQRALPPSSSHVCLLVVALAVIVPAQRTSDLRLLFPEKISVTTSNVPVLACGTERRVSRLRRDREQVAFSRTREQDVRRKPHSRSVWSREAELLSVRACDARRYCLFVYSCLVCSVAS